MMRSTQSGMLLDMDPYLVALHVCEENVVYEVPKKTLLNGL